MKIQMMVQSTPNPNALKFVLNIPVKTEGNYTYTSLAGCAGNPLAEAIFDISPAIREVYFFDNYITVTQDGTGNWEEIEEDIRATILKRAEEHNPDFKTPEPKKPANPAIQGSPELNEINAILDQTIRPALQMDGGDIQTVSYQNKQLEVFYQGACGTCPSATMGTLAAIERILRDQFDPEIRVVLADSY
jgi:Fe-S cluster biogenesis protein NfuA